MKPGDSVRYCLSKEPLGVLVRNHNGFCVILTDSCHEVYISLWKVEVDPIRLNQDELHSLIDLALAANDREWFSELYSKLKAVT